MDKVGRQLDVEAAHYKHELLHWTSNIVTAYLSKNDVDLRQLPHVMETVFSKLAALGQLPASEDQILQILNPPSNLEVPTSATSPANSITPDYIVCLEDGVRLKTLKRYLARKYQLTPDQYRAKWGLSAEYPMVAPNYAAKRSDLAKKMGLGKKRKGAGRSRSGRKKQ